MVGCAVYVAAKLHNLEVRFFDVEQVCIKPLMQRSNQLCAYLW